MIKSKKGKVCKRRYTQNPLDKRNLPLNGTGPRNPHVSSCTTISQNNKRICSGVVVLKGPHCSHEKTETIVRKQNCQDDVLKSQSSNSKADSNNDFQ